VAQELRRRSEYLVTVNRRLRQQITDRVHLTDGACRSLAEIGKRLGKQALEEIATIVKPETIVAWHRRWLRSVKEECLSYLILFGERALWQALTEYVRHLGITSM